MKNLSFMFKFKSEPDTIRELETVVQKMSTEFELDRSIYPNLLISLTEAVNNAIVHGNNMDDEKFVRVDFCKFSDHLKIRVSDEGSGFDYEEIPDPTMPENIETIGGRGVFLMHQLCDKVEYQDNGSTVEISFNI